MPTKQSQKSSISITEDEVLDLGEAGAETLEGDIPQEETPFDIKKIEQYLAPRQVIKANGRRLLVCKKESELTPTEVKYKKMALKLIADNGGEIEYAKTDVQPFKDVILTTASGYRLKTKRGI